MFFNEIPTVLAHIIANFLNIKDLVSLLHTNKSISYSMKDLILKGFEIRLNPKLNNFLTSRQIKIEYKNIIFSYDYFGNKRINCMCFINSHTAVFGFKDASILFFCLKSFKILRHFIAHTDSITGLVFINNSYIISSSLDGYIKIWNSETLDCIIQINSEKKINSFCMSLQNDIVCNFFNYYGIRTFHTPFTNRLNDLQMEQSGNYVIGLCTLNNGLIITGGYIFDDGLIHIYDIETGNIIQEIIIHNESSTYISSICCLSNGGFACGLIRGTIMIYDLFESKYIYSRSLRGHEYNVTKLIQHIDGRLFSSSSDSNIKIWDLNTNQCIRTIYFHLYSIIYFDFIPNSDNKIISCDIQGNVCITSV